MMQPLQTGHGEPTDAASLSRALQESDTRGSMFAFLFAGCVSFHALGSLAAAVGASNFRSYTWLILQFLVGIAALVVSSQYRSSNYSMASLHAGGVEGARKSTRFALYAGLAASVVACLVWAYAIGTPHPAEATLPVISVTAWELVGLVYIAVVAFLALSTQNSFMVVSSSGICVYLPQTSSSVSLWFPRTGDRDFLILLCKEGDSYRMRRMEQDGYAYDLESGPMYILNPAYAAAISRNNAVPVSTSLFVFQVATTCSAGIPRNVPLSANGVHSVAEKLPAISSSLKLPSLAKEAFESVQGQLAFDAVNFKSEFNKARLGHVLDRVEQEASAGAMSVSAVSAVSSALKDARSTYKEICNRGVVWTQITDKFTRNWDQLIDGLNREYRRRIARLLVAQQDLSAEDSEAVDLIIEALGFRLQVTGEWSSTAVEIKELVETVHTELEERVHKIESEERGRLQEIIDRWLGDPTPLLSTGLPPQQILAGLLQCRMLNSVDEMSMSLNRLLTPVSTVAKIQTASIEETA